MAITALEVAWAGWVITVVGWLISPFITLLLPKTIAFHGFDVSKKLEQLHMQIIPELENTLLAVDQARMLDRGGAKKPDVAVLDKMAAMLRHAREDAEDIVVAHKGIMLYRNRCWQRLYSAMKACILSQFGANLPRNDLPHFMASLDELADKLGHHLYGALATCISSIMRKIIALRRSEDVLPVTTSTVAPSDEGVPVTSSAAATDVVPVAAPSDSMGWWLSCLFSFFDLIKNFLGLAVGFACCVWDWPRQVVGITGYQENATLFDYVLTAIPRWNLKKKIEKVDSTVSKVKKSPLLAVGRMIAPEDIANKNRSRIRTPNNRKVFGREALRDSIMAKLRETPHGDVSSSSTSPCYSVIGIYGVAGSGKTTFARYIRDKVQEECKDEKRFDTIMCIHVPETFSVDAIFHEMLKDITKDHHSNISDHEELESKLKKSLEDKRFFLILDDLWVKSKSDLQLQELISPLHDGKKGSKILVTARTKVAAGALFADETMEMPDLDEDEYLSMFMHYALGGTSVNHEEFKSVGGEIAKKLYPSPIAAAIVAGQLGTDLRIWRNTANLDLSNGTMDVLWWSYQQLNPDIRRCFEHCNIVPRRFMLRRDTIAELWIAQGFVKTSSPTEDVGDVADLYIQELVSRSFLQPEKNWYGDYFRIHDLLHDLLDKVTVGDYFRIENARSQREDVSRDVRHLFVQNYDELIAEKILRLDNLRTLFISVGKTDTIMEEKVFEGIWKRLPKLRHMSMVLSDPYRKSKQPSKLSGSNLIPATMSSPSLVKQPDIQTSKRLSTSLRNVSSGVTRRRRGGTSDGLASIK